MEPPAAAALTPAKRKQPWPMVDLTCDEVEVVVEQMPPASPVVVPAAMYPRMRHQQRVRLRPCPVVPAPRHDSYLALLEALAVVNARSRMADGMCM